MASGNRWTWDQEKTDAFLVELKNYKRQKLGEGFEWDSDKVAMLESVRKNLGERWTDDFGKSDASVTEKPIQDMTKEEYQKYTVNLKKEKEAIAIGYRRVSNKYKTLKRTYVKDSKDGLRSGAGQLTKKYWHECHELWGGSAGTEPLGFGLESNNTLEMVDNSGELIDVEADAPKDNPEDEDSDFIASTCTNDTDSVNDGDHSRSVSPASASISCSEDEMKVTRKRKMKPVKTLIDDKRQKLQKRLTQEGKQDIILQHSQKQLDLQQTLIEELSKKDEGLESAMKSMAESAALLNKTLAEGLQFMFRGFQHSGTPMRHSVPGHLQQSFPGYRFQHPGYQGHHFHSFATTEDPISSTANPRVERNGHSSTEISYINYDNHTQT